MTPASDEATSVEGCRKAPVSSMVFAQSESSGGSQKVARQLTLEEERQGWVGARAERQDTERVRDFHVKVYHGTCVSGVVDTGRMGRGRLQACSGKVGGRRNTHRAEHVILLYSW